MARFVEYEDVLALWDKYHYMIGARATEFDRELRGLKTVDARCCGDCRHFRKDANRIGHGTCDWYKKEKLSIDCCSMWGVKDDG